MKKPITDAILKYRSQKSFHTPGSDGTALDIFKTNIDITELAYSDNLMNPSDVIKESQHQIAQIYGTDNVLFSTAGATVLIHTAIRTLTAEAPFLILGNAHKSVFNALRFINAEAFVCTADELEKALNVTHAKTLIVTSPDYFGNTVNPDYIKSLKDMFDLNIIIDASHGSHYVFSDILPKWEPKYFDLVVHSLHKTLPCVTGAAILHVSDRYIDEAKTVFSMIHTTSPLYPTLMSIETGIEYMLEHGKEKYSVLQDKVKMFKEGLKETEFTAVNNDDISRLVIDSKYSPNSLGAYLAKSNIYPEMMFGSQVVFIVTPFNMMYLKDILSSLKKFKGTDADIFVRNNKKSLFGIKKLTFALEFETVDLDKSENRISYTEVGLYPPGSPLLYSGEVITKEFIEFIGQAREDKFGLSDGKILVVKARA